MLCIEKMKEKYPDAGEPFMKAPYCVGGAYLREVVWRGSKDWKFPNHDCLMEALIEREGLEERQAHQIAVRMTELNDLGRIEEAWQELGKALTTEGEPS